MLNAHPAIAATPLMAWLKVTGLIVPIILVGVGGLVLWANPRRGVNRVVLTCALHNSLWLFLLYIATAAPGRVTWLRWACAVGGLLPLHFAFARNIMALGTVRPRSGWLRGFGLWFGWFALLAVVCFTNYFIPFISTPDRKLYGPGYYLYVAGEILSYCWVIFTTLRAARTVEGIKRVELQVWGAGYSGTCVAILVTMVLNAITHNPVFIRLQPLLVFAFYSSTAYAVTTYRIFEASQLARVLINRLVPIAAGVAIGWFAVLHSPAWLGLTASTIIGFALGLVATDVLRQWLARRLHVYSQDTAARRAAFEAARRETRVRELEADFATVLKGWGAVERADVSSSVDGILTVGGETLPPDSPAALTARQLGWFTPERLGREKQTPGRAALAGMLERARLGVVVVAQGPSVAVVSAVGVPASRKSFSYPQVAQLVELTSIFEGPLERALLAEKMQHAEQLATVGMLGASLAHEIRNPLVSLKAFVQLLPTRHNEPAFREKFFALMTEEVKRIDRLTEQLLDLASPRAYSAAPVELNAVVRQGLELVRPRAADAAVEMVAELKAEPDLVLSDPAAIKQVLLNLCLNAIQVLEGREQARWIRIRTAAGVGNIELTVADSGPGIAPEMRGKLFQPFQSTKSSGFGLGLAICRDILVRLDGSISALPYEAGKGAEFRILLPCPR